jgi:hypothetical protein
VDGWREQDAGYYWMRGMACCAGTWTLWRGKDGLPQPRIVARTPSASPTHHVVCHMPLGSTHRPHCGVVPGRIVCLSGT